MYPDHQNNDRLRALIDKAGVTQAIALTIFNRGLGAAAYSMDTFKAFLVRADSAKFRPLKDELLAHAEKQFEKYAQKAWCIGTSTLD
jgi:hypothetical protein